MALRKRVGFSSMATPPPPRNAYENRIGYVVNPITAMTGTLTTASNAVTWSPAAAVTTMQNVVYTGAQGIPGWWVSDQVTWEGTVRLLLERAKLNLPPDMVSWDINQFRDGEGVVITGTAQTPGDKPRIVTHVISAVELDQLLRGPNIPELFSAMIERIGKKMAKQLWQGWNQGARLVAQDEAIELLGELMGLFGGSWMKTIPRKLRGRIEACYAMAYGQKEKKE